jgi:outer membrane protein assembly factor BamB
VVRYWTRYGVMLLTLWVLSIAFAAPTTAQDQCAIAETISYPVDTDVFQMGQNFGTASPRHQGRFHTGEDWHAGETLTEGQPVRAAAAGRVTYSYPLGWGRDGGVIIIEHTFADGSIIYTQYGHITESEAITFPPRFSCVEAGEIIAVIGDARPAPHLHFEVRVASPDIPGPGYSRQDPFILGWRRPAQVIANQRAWLQPSHLWHLLKSTYDPAPPPLVLNDGSMLVIDGGLLRGVTVDGRVLWRVALENRAVSIDGFQGSAYLTYANGDITRVDLEGTPLERWSLDFAPQSPPFSLNGTPIYHTTDNALVGLNPDRREIVWRVDDVPAYSRVHVSDALIALVTASNDRLLLYSHEGALIDEATLRDGAALATHPEGDLIVYSQGGLWHVDAEGVWSEYLLDAPEGGGTSAVTLLEDGRLYLLDGPNVYAYTAEGVLDWEARLPLEITGQAEMTAYGNGLVITSTHGHIVVVRQTGGVCGFTRIYGDDRADLWHQLGADNVLRVSVGDQIIGLDWLRFAGSCAG